LQSRKTRIYRHFARQIFSSLVRQRFGESQPTPAISGTARVQRLRANSCEDTVPRAECDGL